MSKSIPILAAATAAALLAGTALAQAPAATPGAPTHLAPAAAAPGLRHERRHGLRGGPAAGRAVRLAAAVRHDPALAVVANLRAIERLYRHEGRLAELPAFYREQLGKTDDPVVRNFVNYRLARLELRDGDADAALAALRRNLDENYRRL